MTLYPTEPEDGLTPSNQFRWLRRVSPPNQFGVGYRERVLQQFWDNAFDETMVGEWRDVPVEEET